MILERIKIWIRDKWYGIPLGGIGRSREWPRARAEHLSENPTCGVCEGKNKLEVHHKVPFHLNPMLELDKTNLITLCESKKGGVNCHLHYGHLGNYRSHNENVDTDAEIWRQKIQQRP